MNASQLIASITSAFPVIPTPRPGDILYNEEPGYEGSFPVDSELAEIKAFFGDRRWDAVTPQDVFNFRHALSFFSKCARAYYTAAWMTCALVDEEAVDTGIDDLVSDLGRIDPSLWTPEQQRVICEWLNYFNVSNLPSSKQEFEDVVNRFGCH